MKRFVASGTVSYVFITKSAKNSARFLLKMARSHFRSYLVIIATPLPVRPSVRNKRCCFCVERKPG